MCESPSLGPAPGSAQSEDQEDLQDLGAQTRVGA